MATSITLFKETGLKMISIYTENVEDVWFGVAYEEENIFATTFASNENGALHGLLASIPFYVHFQRSRKPSAFAEQVITALKDIYNGRSISREFALSMECLSEYARNVLQVVRMVPLGYVTSYGAIAKIAGGSPRAVGRIMALNPFAPVVPCHRVVNSNFTLGGYGGGLKAKLAFLQREKQGYMRKHEVPFNGRKLQVFPVEFVLERLEKSKC